MLWVSDNLLSDALRQKQKISNSGHIVNTVPRSKIVNNNLIMCVCVLCSMAFSWANKLSHRSIFATVSAAICLICNWNHCRQPHFIIYVLLLVPNEFQMWHKHEDKWGGGGGRSGARRTRQEFLMNFYCSQNALATTIIHTHKHAIGHTVVCASKKHRKFFTSVIIMVGSLRQDSAAG